MSMLGKLFGRKKKELEPSPELRVCIINEESTDLYEVFGITSERRTELVKLTREAILSEEDASQSYKVIVDQCKHVNEVIVCVIVFERMREEGNDPMKMLAKLFGR
jgi:hypothetical protein